jgi:5-methylcytosine-specific restriction endonuclease McrA
MLRKRRGYLYESHSYQKLCTHTHRLDFFKENHRCVYCQNINYSRGNIVMKIDVFLVQIQLVYRLQYYEVNSMWLI